MGDACGVASHSSACCIDVQSYLVLGPRFQTLSGTWHKWGLASTASLGVHALDALNLVMSSNELVFPDSPSPDAVDFLKVARCQWWALRCIFKKKGEGLASKLG
jgi:hypothetical protein